jgi:hypothetical protein
MQPPRVVISAGDGRSLAHVLGCARLITPLDHISVVASAHTAPDVCRALATYGGIELVVQLRECREADVLLPLAHAFGVDPLASVVFLPSDMSIGDPLLLAQAVRTALETPEQLTVLCWTSTQFAAVGRITAFWDLLRLARPGHAALLECYVEAMATDDEARLLCTAYEHMDDVSFHELLAEAPALEVVVLRSIKPPQCLSGTHRISNEMTDAPTMVAHTTQQIDSRARSYRNGS